MITIIVFRTFQGLGFVSICIRPVPLTPCIVTVHYPALSNLQKYTISKLHQKTYNNTILLWYVYHPGVFTFSETAVFAPRWGCVQLTRQLQNCTKFSHNSIIHPNMTSTSTSIKSTNHRI